MLLGKQFFLKMWLMFTLVDFEWSRLPFLMWVGSKDKALSRRGCWKSNGIYSAGFQTVSGSMPLFPSDFSLLEWKGLCFDCPTVVFWKQVGFTGSQVERNFALGKSYSLTHTLFRWDLGLRVDVGIIEDSQGYWDEMNAICMWERQKF